MARGPASVRAGAVEPAWSWAVELVDGVAARARLCDSTGYADGLWLGAPELGAGATVRSEAGGTAAVEAVGLTSTADDPCS